MIIHWPQRAFSMLLPPGMEKLEYHNNRIITYTEMQPGETDPIDVTKDLENEEAEDDIPLVAVVSNTEDEAVVSGSDGEHGEDSSCSAADNKPKRRCVRFDESVQVSTFTKPTKTYPKTPPRHKKAPVTKDDSEDEAQQVTPRPRRATPKKKTTEPVMTPRRMSLRSASKKAKKERETPVVVDDIHASVSMGRHSNSASADETTAEPAVTTTDADPSSTPTRTTRRSLSHSPAKVGSSVTKMDKLRSLTLLSKVPKSVQRELQTPLERIQKHGKDADEHLQLLVVDFPAAATLLHHLCKHPTLVDTVLMQLRSHVTFHH